VKFVITWRLYTFQFTNDFHIYLHNSDNNMVCNEVYGKTSLTVHLRFRDPRIRKSPYDQNRWIQYQMEPGVHLLVTPKLPGARFNTPSREHW